MGKSFRNRPGRNGNKKSNGGSGHVRIIGGEWRGRKLPVADAPGLRPSGDRIRETLFNWLQGSVQGARCADLFAGTGVLGFEAASRGATEVILVEKSRPVAELLRKSAQTLNADQVTIVEGNALEWLEGQASHSRDIVFIDPPFESDLAACALNTLQDREILAPGGLVYLESPRLNTSIESGGWIQVREKEIGEVRIQLLKMPDKS